MDSTKSEDHQTHTHIQTKDRGRWRAYYQDNWRRRDMPTLKIDRRHLRHILARYLLPSLLFRSVLSLLFFLSLSLSFFRQMCPTQTFNCLESLGIFSKNNESNLEKRKKDMRPTRTSMCWSQKVLIRGRREASLSLT